MPISAVSHHDRLSTDDPSVPAPAPASLDPEERAFLLEALRRSEECFRALLRHGNDAIFIVRADGSVEYASPSIERLLGYRRTNSSPS
jgi:PAS domain-containing protein